MKTLLAILLSLSCSLTLAAQTSAAKPAPLPGTDGLACSHFEWAGFGEYPKAAILTTVKINGKEYTYQFDSGDNAINPYGNSEHKDWIQHDSAELVLPHFQFGGLDVDKVLAYRMSNMQEEGVQGTVGLEPLIGRTLIIDYPKQRLCLMNRADLPIEFSRAANRTHAELDHGKLLVTLKMGDKKLDRVIFDTGSSLFNLVMDYDAWKQATGKKDATEATKRATIPAWNQQLEVVGAPSSGDIQFGNRSYAKPLIFTTPSQPTDLHDNYNATQALLGNALFLDSIVILELGSQPRFGVLSPAPSVAK